MQRGFTLIELLVVVAIIGMLSSVVISSLSTARAGAANEARNANISQMMTGMELHYNALGEYPDPGNGGWVCFGEFDDDACWTNGTGFSENTTMNATFDDYVQLPDWTGDNAYGSYEGPIYRCLDRPGGRCTGGEIRWFNRGDNASCGRGVDINPSSYNNAVYCRTYFGSRS